MVAGCNYCEWEPTKKYSYKSELANVENMKAERKKHRKYCQKVENHNKLQDRMMGEIKTFIKAATHESPKGAVSYTHLKWDYPQSLQPQQPGVPGRHAQGRGGDAG